MFAGINFAASTSDAAHGIEVGGNSGVLSLVAFVVVREFVKETKKRALE